MIGSASLILVELRAAEKNFGSGGYFLEAESEVKLAQVHRCAPEIARIKRLVEITIGREVAMIRIGKGGQGRAV